MASPAAPIVLEDSSLRAEFDPKSGALVGLVNKATGWRVHARPELGMSFQMLAPMPDRRNNPILGGKQTPKSFELSEGGQRLTMEWRGLRSEHGGELDITFRATVTLTGPASAGPARAGSAPTDSASIAAAPAGSILLFEGEVENRSPLPLESVSFPCIGDLSLPSPAEPLRRMSSGYAGMDTAGLLPRFDGDGAYYGFDHPRQAVAFPSTPFALSASDRQGLYAGCHDTEAPETITFHWELKPGFETSFSVGSGLSAASGQIDGKPSHLEFTVWHFPFAAPGERRSLSPIALAPYAGTWHKGVDLYKAWRGTWFRRPPAPAWAREVHSWQQIHINSPEDELRCRYADLPRYGEDCARHGVKAIQLVGWNKGGQDRGNPSHDTDDRLGAWQDLKDAIAKIQALGVQLILFSKFTWADRSQPWFRDELSKYATRDPYGDYHVYPGYRYQTPTQLADLNTRRLVPMCQCCGAWRDLAGRELAKTMDLGAAGILYDESQHHGGAIYCFAPDHGHRVPAHVFAGDAPLAEGFRRQADARDPDFLLAGEACYDLEYRHYSISYFRIGSPHHMAVQRYIDPLAGIMVGVAGFNDRNTINQCLMYRYIISYEPLNFKGRLEDFPRTLAYGQAVDDLRRRYRQYLWDGEYRDTQGAAVLAGGQELPPAAPGENAAYSVFRDAKTGKRAVVVVSFDLANELPVTVQLEGAAASLVYATPEHPDPRPTDGSFKIAPASAAVMMEQ